MTFAPAKFFSFFSWSEIRRISLHRARASHLLAGSWHVAVGRNGLSFAAGGGAKLSPGGAKLVRRFVMPHQLLKTPPHIFGQLMQLGHTHVSIARGRALVAQRSSFQAPPVSSRRAH
jgi:hypothetical protein